MNTVTAILVISVAFSIGIHSIVMTIDVIKRWRENKRDQKQQIAVLNNLNEIKQYMEHLIKPSTSDERPVAKEYGGQKSNAFIQTNNYSKKEQAMIDEARNPTKPAASINSNS